MDKRQFLKDAGVLIAGTLCSRFASGEQPGAARTNWAGNYTYSTDRLDLPATVQDVQTIVKSRKAIKALGTRHSFNAIADTAGDQISLKQLDQMVLDEKSRTVAVGAGVRYGQLAPYIDSHGFALHNLASLPHISVAGAVATATHGSGDKNRNLSTAVSAIEFVTADGQVVALSRVQHGERFRGAVVGLGGLGVVTKVTLDVLPTFRMSQMVYENLPFAQLEKHFDDIFSSGYSVSLFTNCRTTGPPRYGSSAERNRELLLPGNPSFSGQRAQNRNFIRLRGIRQRAVRNRWASLVHGLNACRISE